MFRKFIYKKSVLYDIVREIVKMDGVGCVGEEMKMIRGFFVVGDMLLLESSWVLYEVIGIYYLKG